MVYMPYAENTLEDFYPMYLLFKLAGSNLGCLRQFAEKEGASGNKKNS
jgi:hypothetical protein